jgi:hypothetical protein
MKTKFILLWAVLVFALTVTSCKNNGNEPEEEIKNSIITGKLMLVANPCVTEPCLPGMVAAIATDSLNYIITVNNSWFGNGEVIINNDTLRENNSLEALGIILKKEDLFSQIYYEIEIISYKKLN